MINVLIVGSGAREHAIAKALNSSANKPLLYCCGTSNNPGIKDLCQHYWVGDITDVKAIKEIAKQWHIHITIIGPEAPLEKGLADVLWDCGIGVIGPTKTLAQIETSKAFARDLMKSNNITGLPNYKHFSSLEGVEEFLRELGEGAYVVKADGLMSGKGVKVAGDHLHSIDEALAYCKKIFAKNKSLVIEEKLIGQEFSLMCFTDGTSIAPMPVVQDNKRAFEEDKGPNTGGMGSFSDANHGLPFLTDKDIQQAQAINKAVIQALKAKTQENYIGILYGGFIATAKGVYVIEFNARFGDPEALNVLSLLQSDFLEICKAMVNQGLNQKQIYFSKQATVCKYAVPQGYPDNPKKEECIDISSVENRSTLFLAGVDERKEGLISTGARALAYVGVADSLKEAEIKAEKGINQIKGNLFHRKDIGTEALIKKRIDAMLALRAFECV